MNVPENDPRRATETPRRERFARRFAVMAAIYVAVNILVQISGIKPIIVGLAVAVLALMGCEDSSPDGNAAGVERAVDRPMPEAIPTDHKQG